MNNRIKKTKLGISLIVLVITIIVIIILAASVILTINNNNPMSNANRARYESDRANVQNSLSTAIGKIAAEKLSPLNIPAQADISTGIEYILKSANDGVSGGKIGWDVTATNVPSGYETTTILGIKMPKYSADTIWSINVNGQVLVTVGGIMYGPQTEISSEVTTPPTTVVEEDTKFKDPSSSNQIAIIPKGFKVSSVASEQKIDTGLVIISPDNSEFVWVPVSNTMLYELVDTTNMRSHLTEWAKDGLLQGKSIPYSNNGFREPDIITSYDNNIIYLNQLNSLLGTSFTVGNDFKLYLQKEYNALFNSIKTNGGFYMGRYETGDLSKAKVVSQPGNSDVSNQTWYILYGKSKKYATMLTGTKVTSNMIYGFQWDAVMKWMANDSNTQDYIINATGKGNWSGALKPTGTYAVKNIYDMAGNVFDMTVENGTTIYRVMRGGGFNTNSDQQYAGYHVSSDPTISLTYCGSRLSLFL